MRAARAIRDRPEVARRTCTSGSGVHQGSGGRVAALVARWTVVAFYLVAFAVTWAAWIPRTAHAWGLAPFTGAWFDSPLLYIIGGLGPGVAAYAVTRWMYGADGDRYLWAGVLQWRVGMRWYAVGSLAYPVIWLAAAAFAGRLDPTLFAAGTWLGGIATFAMYLVLAVPEEVGWRGFAQLHLQTRHGALVSGLVVGTLWALWHLPLRLHPDEVAAGSSQLWWAVATVAAAVLYAWLFNSIGGSVLLVIVLHAMGNTMSVLADRAAIVAYEAAITVTVAVALVAIFGATNLTRRRRPMPPPGAAPCGSPEQEVRE